MKNKKIKSIFALGLAVSMIMTACGSTPATDDTPSSSSASAESTKAVESTEVTESTSTTEDPIKLTIMTTMSEVNNHPEECLYTDYLEERFNVDLEFIYVASGDFATQYNLMLESGDYPDIITGGLNSTQVTAGAEAGALLPLNDYIKKDSYYQQALEEYPDYAEYLTANDGNIYTFFVRSEAVHQNAQNKLWYRADWIEALGWDHLPGTPEEFKQFLIDIRDNDVNSNGDPTDEIPYMSWSAAGDTNDPIAFMMNPFELYTKDYYYITDDREVYFIANTDGFREGLEYMADLYSEGLIAEETYVQDGSAMLAYVNADVPVVGCFSNWYQASVIDTDVQSWFSYLALPPLKGNYQQTAARMGGVSLSLNSAITTACENPEKAFEIYDWMLSEEANWIGLFGLEGTNYEWVDAENFNGESPAVSFITKRESSDTNWLSGSYPRLETAERRYSVLRDESTYETDNTQMLVLAAEAYEDYHVSINIPWVIWADDETTTAYNEYYNLFHNYITNATTEFIMGIRDINNDGEWQEYVDELNNMGLEDYLSVIETYYGLE